MHSEYRTPKRRHSSLFHRMQQEIQKISRKLSAAKASVRDSSYQNIKSLRKNVKRQYKERSEQGKQKAKLSLFQTTNLKNMRRNIHFDQFPQPSAIETVRIKRLPENDIQTSALSGQKTLTSKTLNRRLNFLPLRQNQEERINKLWQQNQELSMQIKKLETVCADQSYRLGYASAYFDDKCKKLQHQKELYQKENIYLQKLCQHYKSKSKKYKQNLRKYSSKRVSESSCDS